MFLNIKRKLTKENRNTILPQLSLPPFGKLCASKPSRNFFFSLKPVLLLLHLKFDIA